MNNPTILWVDDDPDDLLLFSEIIQSINKDFHIEEALNGRKALELLQEYKQNNNLPCLIILDINMPELNGKETMVRIKENKDFEGIPIVAFSTSNNEMDRMFFKKYGVEMFTKPPEYNSL